MNKTTTIQAEQANANNPVSVTLTDNAAFKISELIKEEENFNLNLRVFITGGGCSGFQYGFIFDENKTDDDICIQKIVAENIDLENKKMLKHPNELTVRLIIDPISFQYLIGAEIDYKSDIKGEQFIIRNPMAKTTCGCGSSFST